MNQNPMTHNPPDAPWYPAPLPPAPIPGPPSRKRRPGNVLLARMLVVVPGLAHLLLATGVALVAVETQQVTYGLVDDDALYAPAFGDFVVAMILLGGAQRLMRRRRDAPFLLLIGALGTVAMTVYWRTTDVVGGDSGFTIGSSRITFATWFTGPIPVVVSGVAVLIAALGWTPSVRAWLRTAPPQEPSTSTAQT